MEPQDEQLRARYHRMRAAIYRVFGDPLEIVNVPRLAAQGGARKAKPHDEPNLADPWRTRLESELLHPRPPHLGPYRVLLVDDEPDILDSLKDCIEGGFDHVQISTATSGQQALRLMEKMEFDLIITDYRMPGMDGFEFLARAERLAPQIPRILITAYAVDVPSLSTELFRVTHFFSKPLRAAEIVAAVREELGPSL